MCFIFFLCVFLLCFPFVFLIFSILAYINLEIDINNTSHSNSICWICTYARLFYNKLNSHFSFIKVIRIIYQKHVKQIDPNIYTVMSYIRVMILFKSLKYVELKTNPLSKKKINKIDNNLVKTRRPKNVHFRIFIYKV